MDGEGAREEVTLLYKGWMALKDFDSIPVCLLMEILIKCQKLHTTFLLLLKSFDLMT